MMKTLCFQLLALLVITSFKFADAKALEESNEAVVTLEKRDPEYQEYEDVYAEEEKRDIEDEEDEDVYAEEEKRDVEEQEDEDVYEELESRASEDAEDMEDEEEIAKRDPENKEEMEDEEEVDKRDQGDQDDEAVDDEDDEEVEKRDPEENEAVDDEEENEEAENEEVEEKRDEEEDSDSETSSENEDLEKRTVQARFTLVDNRGRRINGQREGLLLFNGGTVCDDGFSMNSAHAVCRTMGYRHATRYRNGLVYGSFQSRKRIGLDDVICRSSHWASCRSTTRHNCNHREDILLTCEGTGFKLLSSSGSLVTGQREGLLTYQQGTVCDDYFNMNAAHAICRVMGYAYAVRWRRGLRYGAQQSHRNIVMDDVRCRASWWNYCSYRTRHNCNHHEDVFLTCRPGGTHPPGFRLLDWRGGAAQRGCEGLLIYNGGTVCDDHFNMNAAHAICKVMGYRRGAVRYRNGLAYGTQQTRRSIRMDDVICRSTTWSSCRYRTSHNCSHGEDILLTCRA